MRGFNDDEAVPLARWGREQGFEVRFIEWMPLDFGHTWDRSKLVPAAEILDADRRRVPARARARARIPSAPATRVSLSRRRRHASASSPR